MAYAVINKSGCTEEHHSFPFTFPFLFDGEVELPTAITQEATNIGGSSARINGKITDDGGESCQARFRYRKKSEAFIPSTPVTTLDNTAIRLSSQHGAFYAAGRYWLFYTDVKYGDFEFRSSTDGESWSSATTLGSCIYSGICLDVVFDGTYVHYIRNTAYDVPNYKGVAYRRGTPQSDGSINWSAAEQTVLSDSEVADDCQLAVDSGGYPWVGYSGTSSRYPTVIKSSTNDGTWSTASGFPHTFFTTSGWFVIPVPQTSGKVYCIIYRTHTSEQRIIGYAWDGSWGSQEIATSSDLSNVSGDGIFGMLSAVAIGDDIHLAFMASNENIKYVKRSSGSWGSESTIEATTRADWSSPVLTKRANNDLLCYWLHSDDKAYYKQCISGVWDTNPTELIDETEDGFTSVWCLQAYYEEYSGHVVLVYQTYGFYHGIRHIIGGVAGSWTETEWQNTLETDETYYEDLTGLEAEVEYEFQTQPKNSAGEGVWSACAYFTTTITITPSPAQAIASVVAPTVLFGSTTATPEHIDSLAQVIQPNVRQGNIIYCPTAVDAIGKAVSPFIMISPVMPDPISAIGSVVNPIVVLSSISITPTSIEAIGQVVAPIVSVAGVLYITPAAIDAIGGRVNPTVVLGSIIITPDALSAIGEVVAPNAVQGNIIFGPAFVKALGKVVAPTIIGGQLILEPESIEAIARGENPEIILASMTITPEFIEAIAGVVAPYVLQSWIGRKLRLVIVTSQYRKVNVTTCQKRKVNIVTGQKRKVRVITGA